AQPAGPTAGPGWAPSTTPDAPQLAVPGLGQPSPRWPTDPPLTPASLRALAMPDGDDEGSSPGDSESTQLIAVEPYRFEPKFRRRGGYLVLWLLLLVVVAAAVLLVTGRIDF
ncbi:MAG: hypothetical protein ACREOA_00875, partial [Candidatus Dormibacteria bacterium]